MSELSKHEGPMEDNFQVWSKKPGEEWRLWTQLVNGDDENDAKREAHACVRWRGDDTETRIAVIRSTRTFLSASPEPEKEK